MIHIDNGQIAAMQKYDRINLVNSLAGYKPLHLLGTAAPNGISNLCLVSSVFHLGANPPLIGMVIRPERPHNDTLKNIRSTGEYTLNNVLPEWYKSAHQTSASYPSGVSEFDACGFSELYTPEFKAPFVEQATVRIGLKLNEFIEMKQNATTLVVGEVVHLFINDNLVEADGTINHIQAKTMTVAGLDSYFSPVFLARLTYAKPDSLPEEIEAGSFKSR